MFSIIFSRQFALFFGSILFMQNTDIQTRMKQLEELLHYHNWRYHTLDNPEISDTAYDALLHELIGLEQKYPQFAASTSPTKRVGGWVKDELPKVRHKHKQWSYGNIFNTEELEKWWQRVLKRVIEAGGNKVDMVICAEPKIDGLKLICEYQKGKLVRAVTRGDGSVGEDVTHAAQTVQGIPHVLKDPVDVLVVGEVWMQKKEFDRVNKKQKELDLQAYANPRNLAAGTLRQLDARVAAFRKLDFFAYHIDESSIEISDLQHKRLAWLQNQGFQTNMVFEVCDSVDAIEVFYKKLIDQKEGFEFALDGLVLKLDNKKISGDIGYTAKAPRFAVAYKFPAEEAITKVVGIDIQVGRTGALTPVATFESVQVAGTTVTHASLHNQDEIDRLDIRVGDTVVVKKSGDIIPQVLNVFKELRPADSKVFSIPVEAQSRGWKVEKRESVTGGDSAAWYVIGGDALVEQKLRRIEFFVSKAGLDIDGLGPQIIRKLYDENVIKDYPDVFTIEPKHFLAMEGFKETLANKLCDAIANKKQLPPSVVLKAIGIPLIGAEVAKLLMAEFVSIINLLQADFESVVAIDGIGPGIAKAVIDWQNDEYEQELFTQLQGYIEIVDEKITKKEGVLSGKIVAITGTLSKPRSYFGQLVVENGGKVGKQVSSKTNFLLAGEKAGSKLKKANELGVEVLGEEGFLQMVDKD